MAAPVMESVMESRSTQEATVQINGEKFQRIQVSGRDYFMKMPRPGSALIEVLCHSPSTDSVSSVDDAKALRGASRSAVFVQQLVEGCTAKQGVRPDRFTFEQPTKKAVSSGDATPTPRPFGAHSFPSDMDPHVIPDAVSPTNEFPETRF